MLRAKWAEKLATSHSFCLFPDHLFSLEIASPSLWLDDVVMSEKSKTIGSNDVKLSNHIAEKGSEYKKKKNEIFMLIGLQWHAGVGRWYGYGGSWNVNYSTQQIIKKKTHTDKNQIKLPTTKLCVCIVDVVQISHACKRMRSFIVKDIVRKSKT